METLNRRDAIRIALAAQGLDRAARPGGARASILRSIDRSLLLQIDSVNVLMRAHYLPLFSRLGLYDRALLDEAAWAPRRRALFEYWGHEASLLPLGLQPFLRWRMARAERGEEMWSGVATLARERPEFIRTVLREVEIRGPVGAGDLDRANHKGGGWWGWTETKIALEYLFWSGRITAASRRGFERIYDLTERVLPAAILDLPTPDEPEAQRHLIALAAGALGVATESDLRDYFRLPLKDARPRVAELVETGQLIPVAVEGWPQPAFMAREATHPRRAAARALISPFDPLIWDRDRTLRLFGFRYRLEIYTPAHKRQHGYYVLPFLMGDRLVARVDLKAERKDGALRVASAHLEPCVKPEPVAAALGDELSLMARWLGLERIVADQRGDLAAPLIAYLSSIGGTERGSGPV